MRCQWYVVIVVGLALLLCGCDVGDEGRSSGPGESCTRTADCEKGLRCLALVCQNDVPTPEGTWKDPMSGLTWQTTPTGGPMKWFNAEAHCIGLSLDSGGWRLPTVSELRTLLRGCPATEDGGSCNVEEGCLEYSCWDISCASCFYLKGPTFGCYWPENAQGACTTYWSSSTVTDDNGYAWYVSFDTGLVVSSSDVDAFKDVRCVRP